MGILKFRAWDIANKKFTYWTMNDLCTWDTKEEKPSALDEWQQDTGLKDKNGKEIYEGDIVKARENFGNKSERVCKIVWDDSDASFYLQNISDTVDSNTFKSNSMFQIWEADREIIGNIYSNPELLHD